MAGEEYTSRRGTALGEDYREVNNRRGREGQGGGEDYREVTREKMRFLRTLTVRRFSPCFFDHIFRTIKCQINPLKMSGDPKPWFRLGSLHPLCGLTPCQEHQVIDTNGCPHNNPHF